MKSLKYLLIVVLAAYMSACGGSSDGSSDGLLTAPTDENGNPEEGTVTVGNFYVRMWDEGKFNYVMWSPDTADGSCTIDADDKGEDIVCILDVHEGDAWYHGIKLQHNLPPEMCDYFRHEPYWFYNYETGYGPTNVSVSFETDVNGEYEDSTMDCTVGTTQTNVNVCTYDEVTITMNGTSPVVTCAYDHTTNFGDSYPNCCMGNYDYTVTELTDAGDTVSSTTQQSWGATSVKSCLAGPANDEEVWSHRDDFLDYPLPSITYISDDGINATFEASPGAGATLINLSHNIYVSNYFDYDGGTHTHRGYGTTNTENAPYAVIPIDDRSGDGIPDGEPYYYYGCLDKAFEYNNRIRVLVREWNTVDEFTEFLTDIDLDDDRLPTNDPTASAADPDVKGTDESTCGEADFGSYCNDRMDWKDVLDNIADWGYTGYAPDPTASGDATDRLYFFPGLYHGPDND